MHLDNACLQAVAGTEMASHCREITLDCASSRPAPLGALAELLRVFPRLRVLEAGRVALDERPNSVNDYSRAIPGCVSDDVAAASLDRRPLPLAS
jgi:hypothetical protein